VEYLEGNADVSAVFTEATTIDECGIPFGVIGAVPGNSHGVRRLGFVELLRSMLLYNNYLVCPSAMVRTEIYKYEIKEWGNSLFRSASDVDIWLRLSKRGQIAVLDEPLMRYRISGMQFSYLNRTRTERLDFFRVMDDYLSRPEVRDFLTRADFRHYGWLERHECVARSMNLFALGRVAESRKLLTGILTWDAVHAAVRTRRGFVTLMGLALLRIAIPFGASARVRAIVGAAKRISWR
jgi:hypothetical protein